MTGSDQVRRWWLDVDGRFLHRLDFGGPGPLVMCLHGVTSCAWVWHHVAGHLIEAGHGVVACDLRGHGDSSWARPDEYRSRDLARDAAAVVADLGGGPVDVVGSSWGALVGLALAAERPDLVRHLVMVDIEPSFSQPEFLDPPRPGRFASVAEVAANWRATNPSAPEDLIALLAVAASRPDGDGGRVPLHDPLFLERWPFRSEDWWSTLDAVEVPTLVIHAEHTWVRGEVCDQMAERLPRGQRVDLPGASHTAPIDAPFALAEAVATFLGS
jgi:pimeloyl-ACP methyl ester carboxylesterase